MAKSTNPLYSITPNEAIINKIFFIREQKVMLDRDLADMYGVKTKRLNEQLKRNSERFPPDFMFQLTKDEFNHLKSHFATSSSGGIRKLPVAFTEQVVSMLSGVLNSSIANQVHIPIIRVFTKMRELLADQQEIFWQLEKRQTGMRKNREAIALIFESLKSYWRRRPICLVKELA